MMDICRHYLVLPRTVVASFACCKAPVRCDAVDPPCVVVVRCGVVSCLQMLQYCYSTVCVMPHLGCSVFRAQSLSHPLSPPQIGSIVQLPHIGEAEAKVISTSKPPCKGIAQYIKLPREERKVRNIKRKRRH